MTISEKDKQIKKVSLADITGGSSDVKIKSISEKETIQLNAITGEAAMGLKKYK